MAFIELKRNITNSKHEIINLNKTTTGRVLPHHLVFEEQTARQRLAVGDVLEQRRVEDGALLCFRNKNDSLASKRCQLGGG